MWMVLEGVHIFGIVFSCCLVVGAFITVAYYGIEPRHCLVSSQCANGGRCYWGTCQCMEPWIPPTRCQSTTMPVWGAEPSQLDPSTLCTCVWPRQCLPGPNQPQQCAYQACQPPCVLPTSHCDTLCVPGDKPCKVATARCTTYSSVAHG